MSDIAVATSAPASPKKKRGAVTRKLAPVRKSTGGIAPKPIVKKATTSDHPKVADMVQGAIKGLGERGGSSLKAIKKFIIETYKADAEKLAPFIKRYLRSAVEKEELVQTKGVGANGSFKLPSKAAKKAANAQKKASSSPKKAKTATAKKPVGAAKKSKSPAKKAAKKPAVPAKKAGVSPSTPVKKPAAVAAAKAEVTKKPVAIKAKSPAKPKAPKVTKSPKPKKVAKTKASPKKAAPKKK